ncbi:MAG: hypothetical protein QXO92_04900 [Candidatus Bathyarchaeia archaeon]
MKSLSISPSIPKAPGLDSRMGEALRLLFYGYGIDPSCGSLSTQGF